MILCVNPTVDGYEEIQVILRCFKTRAPLGFQHALKFGELTKDVMIPRAPPVPPKTVRTGVVLREVENQPVPPLLFTEFK